jgi:dipeptidase E
MLHQPKLFLYSLAINGRQATALTNLVGKEPDQINFALIENAADIVPNSKEWLWGFREMLRSNGYQLEPLDLRRWRNKRDDLQAKLADKDVIWIGGGHTYYLRWILRHTGADVMITELVKQGKVFAGWSAGAIVAGPTTQYFDAMGDDPEESPEVIMEGLRLTDVVVVPHLNNKDFSDDAIQTNRLLEEAGYHTQMLTDNQVLVIDGGEQKII